MSMMQAIISDIALLEMLCKQFNKWGMMFNIRYLTQTPKMEDLEASAPWVKELTPPDRIQAFVSQGGFLFFDTEDELNAVYKVTLGDDHSTDPRAKIVNIYALTCDPQGELMNENT